MDEPLSNLDAKLRVQMRGESAALQARLGTTTVYVTHDQSEAMTLGDRVAVLGDGRLQQCDTPRGLYGRPANTLVAGFIGSPAMNLCRVGCNNGSVELGGVSFPLPQGFPRREVIVVLRPESLEVASEGIAVRGRGRRGARCGRLCLRRGRGRKARGARRDQADAGARSEDPAAPASGRGALLRRCDRRPALRLSRRRSAALAVGGRLSGPVSRRAPRCRTDRTS